MPPSQDQAAPKPMQREDMLRGMALLDAEIGKSEFLMSIAPIRLISVGGSLADPDYVNEFTTAVNAVARDAFLQKDWLNRDLEIFVARSRRMDLFLASVDQNIRIYDGTNLVVYAGRLEWALERKMRRIGHAADRQDSKGVDLTDAVALVHRMVCDSGRPLTYAYVSGLNWNGFDAPPTKAALDKVAQAYVEAYGEKGLVELDSNEE